METKIGKEKRKINKKLWVIIGIAIAILAIVGGVFAYYAINASTDKIFDGVYVGEVHLGGLTESEATKLLAKKFPTGEINVRLRCEDKEFDIYGSQVDLKADYSSSAKAAAKLGKNGSIFKKISTMNKLKDNHRKVPLTFTCDTNMLGYAINENLQEMIVDVTQYSVEIGENSLIVTNGKDGKGVNVATVMTKISEAYMNGTINEVIDIKIEQIEADSIDPDLFYKEYNREAVDAVLNRDGENYTIEPEVIGIKLDRTETERILKENADNSEPYEIPAQIMYPEVTKEDLEAEFTDCIIATYRSDYSTSSANRKENIRLASSAINGKILNPGEVFSYNDVVGPRTEAAGYKMAHVYSGGKTVDGIGGGICQVSSTLYNAVVFADLEIVYRTNHSMPVSYVPLGRDATVSYGTIDFKFKNNKPTPVKIEIIADGTYVTVNIYGRKSYIKDISIETTVTGSIAYTTTEIEDDTMYEDETKVEQTGSNGTTVEAYKVVKENGVVISRTLLCKSSYIPTAKIVRVGTKKRENVQEPESSDEGGSEQNLPPNGEPPVTENPENNSIPSGDANPEVVAPPANPDTELSSDAL
ncbi:MAG: VanW family protein [Clostridia bacterium]|nr:VanW family protein [Clostridia bacterium]